MIVTIECVGGEKRHACGILVGPLTPRGWVMQWVRDQKALHRERFPECKGVLEYVLTPEAPPK